MYTKFTLKSNSLSAVSSCFLCHMKSVPYPYCQFDQIVNNETDACCFLPAEKVIDKRKGEIFA